MSHELLSNLKFLSSAKNLELKLKELKIFKFLLKQNLCFTLQ